MEGGVVSFEGGREGRVRGGGLTRGDHRSLDEDIEPVSSIKGWGPRILGLSTRFKGVWQWVHGALGVLEKVGTPQLFMVVSEMVEG
jgi:hypothetical protein